MNTIETPEQPDPLIALGDVPLALALLTRLPSRVEDDDRRADACWAYPLAGVVVALIAALVGCVAMALAVPAPMAAGLSLLALVVTTGAMHEDGLADCADGLWGGWTPAKRLEIMKDSRIGAYGVIALVLGLGLRWAALSALFEAGAILGPLVGAAALSRATLPVLMNRMKNARDAGLSKYQGQPYHLTVVIGCVLALALAWIAVGFVPMLLGALMAALAALAAAMIAYFKIGGQTGDVLGATQQLTEIAVLATFAALLIAQ